MSRSDIRVIIEIDREVDGRWIADASVSRFAGAAALVYGATREEAIQRARAIVLESLIERQHEGTPIPDVIRFEESS